MSSLSIYLARLLTWVLQDGLGECLYPPEIVRWYLSLGINSDTNHAASGPRFRKHRRFINQVFNQKGISTFRPLQEKEMLVLLEGLLHRPDDCVDHFRRFATFNLDRHTYNNRKCSTDMLLQQFSRSPTGMTYFQLMICLYA